MAIPSRFELPISSLTGRRVKPLHHGTTFTDCLILTNSTKYLLAQDYYKTWQNLITDKVKLDQMAQVLKHFKDLSYSISQQVNSTSTITFKWSIEW